MKTLRITLAQINSTVGDLSGNCEIIIRCIREAKKLGSDIVVFPELALSGYPPEDLLLRPEFIKANRQYLNKIIKHSDSILTIVGFPHFEKGKLFNAACLTYKKRILAIYKKRRLPNYGVFDELRYFSSADKDLVWSFKGLKFKVNICEDIWFESERNAGRDKRADIIINISSSPYHINKLQSRRKLLSKRAAKNRAFVFYCNLVGGQDELVFDGASMVFDQRGRLLARSRQFEEDFLTVDIQSNQKQAKSKRYLCLSAVCSRIEKRLESLEEIYAALRLALKDYVAKNGFKRVVLGLSGGIDSALVATLAVDALGKENVVALSMPSSYSSAATLSDAKKISQNLGIKLRIISIDSIFKHYLRLLRQAFKGKKTDTTEENLQARIRGNLLMAFSNKFGLLVVTTGNKSELSVGYCTLYGDTVGGFALLKDVPKMLVYELARFGNQKGGKDIIPQSVFKRPPSAELRKGQTDQDKLPAYSTLDKIVDEYVQEDRSVEKIVNKGFNQSLTRRIIKMIDKNEYKRRQYAVGVKITPKAFGRDRRMPITNKFSH